MCYLQIPTLTPLQVGCPGSEEDVVRPYSCLPYTWDDPDARGGARLAIDLPGGRRLGAFALNEVGRRTWVRPSAGRGDAESVTSPSSSSAATSPPLLPPPSWLLPDNDDAPAWHGSTAAPEQRGAGRLLLVVVAADGPTRVLRVVDADRHPLLNQVPQASLNAVAAVAAGSLLPASPAASSLAKNAAASSSMKPSVTAGSPAVPLLTVSVELSSVGISIVSRREELMYLSIQVRR